MSRILYILALVFIIASCSSEGEKSSLPDADIALSIRETDSVVVASLINKSKANFSLNKTTTPAFDEYLKDAEELAISNDFQKPLSEIYHLVGVRHRNRSEYGDAIRFATKALDIGKTLDDKSTLANYINMAAVVYRRVDENSKAMELHMQAMELAEEVNDSFQIAVSLNGVGNVYLNLERYHASIEYFKQSFEIAVSRGNVLGQAINTNNIGESLKHIGEIDSALVYFYESLDYNTQIDSKVGQAICFNSIGDAYRLKKDYNQALKYLRKALVLNRETRDFINVAMSYSILGETYLEVHDYENAIINLKEGLRIGQEIGSKYMIETCARLLSQAYEKQYNLRQSLEYLKLSQAYKDSIFDEKSVRHIAVITTTHEAEQAKAKIVQLNNESSLQKSLIKQQKRAIVYFVFFVLAIIGAAILIYRQSKLNEGYKSILMQQRLLRSQMNPHFIFNALSAIQVYILENDMDNSSRFLADFAKLMRLVLRSSQREYITLEEEKDMLEYYLKLQQLRFVDSFDFEVSIEEELDSREVLIPPMITQPFVENSIEHGLKSLGRDGRVKVRFRSINKKLLVEIEDNGIGLTGAKLRKDSSSKHESMATQITNDRLHVIEKMTKTETLFEINDLQEISPQKSGVLVRIEIPIIEAEDLAKKK